MMIEAFLNESTFAEFSFLEQKSFVNKIQAGR